MVNTGPFAECARRSRTARAGSSAAVRPVRAHRMAPNPAPTGAPKGVAKRVARPGGPHGHPSLGARIIARLGLPPARARLGHSACAHWGRDVEGSPRQAGRRHPTRPVGSAVAPVPGLGASPPRNPGGRARKPMVACLPGRAAQPEAPPLGALSRPRRRTVMTKNRGNDSCRGSSPRSTPDGSRARARRQGPVGGASSSPPLPRRFWAQRRPSALAGPVEVQMHPGPNKTSAYACRA